MDEVARRQRAKRIGGAIGGILVGVLMALFLHPEGLSQQGCYVLAILAGSIVWWICGVLPEFATALIMVMLFALVGGIPASRASRSSPTPYGGYSSVRSPSVWE